MNNYLSIEVAGVILIAVILILYLYVSNTKQKFKKLTTALDTSTVDIEQLKAANEKLQTGNSTLENELAVFRNKFLPFESRIIDIENFQKEISYLQNKIDDLNSQKKDIGDDYATGKKIYDDLNKEIAALEDRLEIYSYGLYTPHFNFDTSEMYKEQLNKCYLERVQLVKNEEAVVCSTTWSVNGSKVEGKRQTKHYTKMMLRAFNGECDAAIVKTKWNNIATMELRVLNAFNAINKLGETHNILIKNEYLDVRLKELRLTYEYQEKIHDELDEQRRIREQIREEERALKEMEAARIEAEKEEDRYSKALVKARLDLSTKHGVEKDSLLNKISQLEESLRKAQELKERAISMAQITKSGYVYVISNVGSFGENVYKIGMTRRLEPADRVRELSGASVPFSFDIHAMIYSQNAPELENNFHRKFKEKRVNWVNGRKEFFTVALDEIEIIARELNHEIEFTKIAEARDFRETKARLEMYKQTGVFTELDEKFPNTLFLDNADEDDESSPVNHAKNQPDAALLYIDEDDQNKSKAKFEAALAGVPRGETLPQDRWPV